MGILDRLKDLVATMNEEEKKEFFSEIEKDRAPEEPEEPEAIAPPDVIECTQEETAFITGAREQILSAKVELSSFIISAREAEARGISLVKAKEDDLLNIVSQIKRTYLLNPDDHDKYLIELPSTSNDTIKLVKQ